MHHRLGNFLRAKGVQASLARGDKEPAVRGHHAHGLAIHPGLPRDSRLAARCGQVNGRHLAGASSVEPVAGLDAQAQVGGQVPAARETRAPLVGVLVVLAARLQRARLQLHSRDVLRDDAVVGVKHRVRRQYRPAEVVEVFLVSRIKLDAREARRVELALKIRPAARVGELLVIEPTHVVEVAAVGQVLPRAGHEPCPLRQPRAPAPAHGVLAQLAGLQVKHRRQLRAAWRHQPAVHYGQVALRRKPHQLLHAMVQVGLGDLVAVAVGPDGAAGLRVNRMDRCEVDGGQYLPMRTLSTAGLDCIKRLVIFGV